MKKKFFSEIELIRFLETKITSPKNILGIGDDAAVVTVAEQQLLLTTDTLVENVHFRASWTTPIFLGRKAALVNLSDIAAMGGRPLYALVSLILSPQFFTQTFITGLYEGLEQELALSQTVIVGGNISKGKELSLTLTLIGSISGQPLTRSGASVGELLLCTGELGTAAAELYLLLNRKQWQAKYLPSQRLRFTQLLAKDKLATACLDISDGLALDLYRLCVASGVGSVVFEKKIPVAAPIKQLAQKYCQSLKEWVLNTGEDYELLFTVKKTNLDRILQIGYRMKTPVSVIGEISKNRGQMFLQTNGTYERLLPRGWDHLQP